MAKSARSSTKKSNNSKLKSRVFGPIESARTERLSLKLLELASQPRPPKKSSDDVVMEAEAEGVTSDPVKGIKETDDMDVDQAGAKAPAKPKTGRGRIQKKRSNRSKASIVFPKYKPKAKR